MRGKFGLLSIFDRDLLLFFGGDVMVYIRIGDLGGLFYSLFFDKDLLVLYEYKLAVFGVFGWLFYLLVSAIFWGGVELSFVGVDRVWGVLADEIFGGVLGWFY